MAISDEFMQKAIEALQDEYAFLEQKPLSPLRAKNFVRAVLKGSGYDTLQADLEEAHRSWKAVNGKYAEMASAVAAFADPDDFLQGMNDGPEKANLEAVFGQHRQEGWV